jgi:phosphate transport system permease protein
VSASSSSAAAAAAAAESSARSLSRRNRRGAFFEVALSRTLASGSVGLGALYALGLAWLVARGAGKVLRFTSYATPIDPSIDGEARMRFFLALAVFGALAWGVAAGARTLVPRLPRTCARGFIAAVAFGGALLFRDHLPRFLIALPTETTAGGGVGPELFNTLYFAALSTAMTLPIGVGAAVYMARFARASALVSVLRTALDTLASLPSIVYGLFGFLVFVVQMRLGYSLFAGAFVLALLNLPLVVGTTEESLRAVPRDLEDASLALGATRSQTVLRVTLPYAWPGILSALVLSIGRVFAESAPLIMTAGTTISRATAFSLDPFRGGETLAVHLWYVNSAGLSPDRADVSAGTAAVLVVLVGLTNLLAARLAR